MYHIVFSRNRTKDDVLTSNLFYEGVSKSEAVAAFTEAAATSFNVTTPAANLYFACFNSDLPFIADVKRLIDPTALCSCQPERKEIVNIVLRNIGLATCVNTLNTSGYKPKLTVARTCVECDSSSNLVQKTVYGDYLCVECWVKYWTTRKSLAEYVVGLANGMYKLDSFSEEDKAFIKAAWEEDATDVDGTTKIPNSSNRKLVENGGVFTAERLNAIEASSGLFTE